MPKHKCPECGAEYDSATHELTPGTLSDRVAALQKLVEDQAETIRGLKEGSCPNQPEPALLDPPAVPADEEPQGATRLSLRL